MTHKYASLPPSVMHILQFKGTEPAFSGKYSDTIQKGSYLCRGCGAVLFRASSQFISSCGWPSFDDAEHSAVKHQPDADKTRTEVVCAQCKGHLGHVFSGEQHTEKDTRYCINSLAIEFVSNTEVSHTEEAIVAGGCFWGVQHLFSELPGVLLTESGYIGGTTNHPTYKQVCANHTGRVEAVRVVFDSDQISYEDVIKFFMEIHNPVQADGRGPDIGTQYLSRIFYFNEAQKNTAQSVIQILEEAGLHIATQLKPVSIFWPAEMSHQNYYKKHGDTPYCHRRTKRF